MLLCMLPPLLQPLHGYVMPFYQHSSLFSLIQRTCHRCGADGPPRDLNSGWFNPHAAAHPPTSLQAPQPTRAISKQPSLPRPAPLPLQAYSRDHLLWHVHCAQDGRCGGGWGCRSPLCMVRERAQLTNARDGCGDAPLTSPSACLTECLQASTLSFWGACGASTATGRAGGRGPGADASGHQQQQPAGARAGGGRLPPAADRPFNDWVHL